MKKAILLLGIFTLAYGSLFAQRSNQFLPTNNNNANTAMSTAFKHFESTIFTESNQQEIIESYLTLGKNHQAAGNVAEATAFYKRAFALTNDYFNSLPGKQNPLAQLKNTCQTMLMRCYPGAQFSELEMDSIRTAQFLQQYKTHSHSEFRNQDNTTDEKVVASFFLAATEPADSKPAIEQFKVIKSTSLRRGATHKSKSLKRLSHEDRVSVLERTSKHWWLVDVNGQTGYVKALLLKP